MIQHKKALIGGMLLGGAMLMLSLQGCSQAEDPWKDARPGQKKVLVSFPPLYCFAKNVAGDDAGDDACVKCLLTTEGPHGYTTTQPDRLKALRADLFLINGLELDDFIVTLAKDARNRQAEIVRVADAILEDKIIATNHEHHEHDADGKCCHGEHDPHVWLSPELAKIMVDRIAEKLAYLDPANRANYLARAAAYKDELTKLHEYGVKAFHGKKGRKIVTQHDSLRYFAQAFGLHIVDSIHPRPGTEGDAKKMAELIKICKDENVAAICVEPQYAKGGAEALQKQLQRQGLKVQLVEVDPLETAPGNPNPDPNYYLTRMRQNIDNLAQALP